MCVMVDAVQVFSDLCPAVGLQVGLAAAQTSVGNEAAALFNASIPQNTHGMKLHNGALLFVCESSLLCDFSP